MVFREEALIDKRALEIDGRRTRRVRCREAHVVAAVGVGSGQHQFAVFVAPGGIVGHGGHCTLQEGCVLCIPCEFYIGFQAGGDDVREILRQRQQGLRHHGIVAPVSGVVQHVVGVDRARLLRDCQHAVRKYGRRSHGGNVHRVGVQVVRGRAGSVFGRVLRGERKAQLRRLGNVDVDVRAEAVLVEVHLGIVTVVVSDIEHTAFRVVGCRNVVTDFRGAARDARVYAAGHGQVLEDGVDPVDVRIEVGVAAAQVHLAGIVRNRHLGAAAVAVEFVVVVDPLRSVRQLGQLDRLRNAEFGLDADLGRRHFGASFGGDQDDAVRTAHTVEGGRRCVLQDGERGDVVRVDKVHVALDTVDEHQRGGFGTERTLSADPELGARSGFARTLHHDDTRQFAGEVRGERAACHFQFAGVDGVDGADDTLLALFTVCDYGYRLQFGNLAHQLGHDVGLRSDGNALGFITQVRNLDYIGRLYVDREGTVITRDDTAGTALDDHGGSRYTRLGLVQDASGHLDVPPPLRGGNRRFQAACGIRKFGICAQFRNRYKPQYQHE